MCKRLGKFLAVFTLLVSLSTAMAFAVPGSIVKVVKASDGWELIVNGNPFYVKGVGCNEAKGTSGEDFMKMARDMGANAVRNWGGATREYLDKARSNGLMVDLGFWLNPIRGTTTESYQDKAQCDALKKSILSYVDEMKDHPALLSWNIGNEVFHFTEDNNERIAFGRFLEDVIEQIHKHDPNHPVIYASAYVSGLPFLKEYVPSLDIVGANVYGNFTGIKNRLKELDYDKPILATEFGPYGAWDVKKDKNALPYDPSDQIKASNYDAMWKQIQSIGKASFGGFAFVLGNQRNQDSLTWWNVNLGDNRRAAYWTLYKLYTGCTPANEIPRISSFATDISSPLTPGARFQVKTTLSSPLVSQTKLRYKYFITNIFGDPLIVEQPCFFPANAHVTDLGTADLQAPATPGKYRVYVTVSDDNKNIAVADRSILVVQ
ncbi:MAG: glycoside hydrolase family 2 TIM barrel-domain containing protein [Endomicrobiales bacterium]|jgi:hypothetical protein